MKTVDRIGSVELYLQNNTTAPPAVENLQQEALGLKGVNKVRKFPILDKARLAD